MRWHEELLRADIARVGIGHALVDNCSSQQVCESIITHAQRRGQSAYVITPNAQHIVLLEGNRRLREIYASADLIIPDGVSLLLAARVHGRVLQERIAGVDVFQRLCGLAADKGLRVFLLGGRPGSADLAAAQLTRDHPRLKCTTFCPPLGFEQNADGLRAVADAVTAARPHLLFVALGAPKQEYWIHEHGIKLSVPVCIGVGGSFEMVGGVVGRAPAWVQNLGCEWVYRLCQEPRRMWHRYLVGNIQFATIVLRQRMRRVVLNSLVRTAAKDSFAAELPELIELAATHQDSVTKGDQALVRDEAEGETTPFPSDRFKVLVAPLETASGIIAELRLRKSQSLRGSKAS